MNGSGYGLLALIVLVVLQVATLTFAVLRLSAAARAARRNPGAGQPDMMSAALQEAVTRLQAQERATAARAEASERLSGEIISGLSAGLLVVGLEGEIRILNPAGRRMLNLPESAPPDVCRRSLDELALSAVIDECLRTQTPVVRRSVTLPEARHGVSHVGITVSPLFDDDNKLHGAICLFTDLTAVKDLEEQLRLKNSLATVGELTAGIAHEFRNGLATIHGYSKLLDIGQLPESYRPYVEGIRAEAESLGQVVTNFLNFARPAQLTLTKVDLGAVCERAAEEARVDARAAGGEVEVHGEFDMIEGDEVLLRQAFSNLLRNAIEACAAVPIRPRIVVRAEIDRAQRLSRITVNDNGPGVAAALRERVFRPFFTTKRSGTGLGLALVQKIVVFHNGRVTVGTSPEGGAAVNVALPLTSEDSAAAPDLNRYHM